MDFEERDSTKIKEKVHQAKGTISKIARHDFRDNIHGFQGGTVVLFRTVNTVSTTVQLSIGHEFQGCSLL